MANREDVQAAFVELAKPGMTSKKLQKAIEERFPKVSKKDIRIAAFAAMIQIADKNPAEAIELQDFALTSTLEPKDG